MAGAKETPRQKMIGMMYLVLLAMLALQVSNAVLEKFAIVNETLNSLVQDGSKKSEETLTAIVDKTGKSTVPKVVRARENAQKVRQMTKDLIAYLDNLKKEMMAKSGTDKIDEKLINDHSSKVAAMMMDATAEDNKGKEYEKRLNDYVKQLSDLSGEKYEKIAKSPAEMPLFAADEKHANKNFLTFTFENTPPIAALASVTQVETEVLALETKALTKLSEAADVGVIRFDQFVPMVRAKSSVVAAGAKYEAELFLTGSSTAITPEFYKDGAKLVTVNDPTGVKMGKIEFTAAGGGYNAQGIAEKSFKAEIKMNDTTFSQGSSTK